MVHGRTPYWRPGGEDPFGEDDFVDVPRPSGLGEPGGPDGPGGQQGPFQGTSNSVDVPRQEICSQDRWRNYACKKEHVVEVHQEQEVALEKV